MSYLVEKTLKKGGQKSGSFAHIVFFETRRVIKIEQNGRSVGQSCHTLILKRRCFDF